MVQTSLMTTVNSLTMFMQARDVNNLLADDWHMHLVHQYFKVFNFPFFEKSNSCQIFQVCFIVPDS